MLAIKQLNENDRDNVLNLLTDAQRYLHYNRFAATSIQGMGYIASFDTYEASAIYILNNFDVTNCSIGVPANVDNLEVATERIKSLDSVTKDHPEYNITMVYTPEGGNGVTCVESIHQHIKSNLEGYIDIPDHLKETYQRCASLVQEREGTYDPVSVRVCYNPDNKRIVVITNYLDPNQISLYYLTLSLLPVLYPEIKDKLDEEELNFFKLLTKRALVKRINNIQTETAYRKLIKRDKYTGIIKKHRLDTMIKNILDTRSTSARRTCEAANDRMQQALNDYNRYCNDYYANYELLKNLEATKDEVEQEIINAINMDGVANVEQISASTIAIDIVTTADFFNLDEAELAINSDAFEDWVQDLFNDVFVKQKYKLRVCTQFYFSYRQGEGTFQTPGGIDMNLLKKYDAMYNPHIQYFSCLGDYKPQLIKAHASKDLVLFNNLALASTKSINFRDGAVMNRWARTLKEYDRAGYNEGSYLAHVKCLIDADGNTHSIDELYIHPAPEPEVEEPEPIVVEPVDAMADTTDVPDLPFE